MAYSPINNNKFDSGDVIIGADIAQLNDNIEDTRTLTVNQYATVYEWSNHSEVGQTVADNSGNDATFTFEAPTTTTYFGSKEFDFLTSDGLLDATGTVFGDNISAKLIFDYDLTNGPSGTYSDSTPYFYYNKFYLKIVYFDGTERVVNARVEGANNSTVFGDGYNSLTGTAYASFGFSAGLNFDSFIGKIQSIAVMDYPSDVIGDPNSSGLTRDVVEKIRPIKLTIEVNV